MLSSNSDKDVRSCIWSTISYPDSSSIIDISEALKSHFIPAVISPLHCKDVNDDGSLNYKKSETVKLSKKAMAKKAAEEEAKKQAEAEAAAAAEVPAEEAPVEA